MVGGGTCASKQSHTPHVGNPQTGQTHPQEIPMPGDLASGGAPGAFGVKGQQGLCAGVPQDWGKQILLLEGAHRLSCALGLRTKQRLHRNLGQTYLQILEDLLGKEEAHLEAEVLGIIISVNSPGGGDFGNTWPYLSGLRSPRANNNQVNIDPPISKQAA